VPCHDLRTGSAGREIALARQASRYHHMMKKSTLKLEIRHEVVRVLAQLDLVRVVGGGTDALQMDTGGSPVNTCVQRAQPLPAKP
jgi:hypothetical protein